MNWVDGAGYLASALVLATFCMKTMVPLRVAAICSNVAFVVYAFYDDLFPVLTLHLILLPLNALRTAQMLRFTRRVESAAKGDFSVEWLRPFMKETRRKAGEILFSDGDYADCLFMVVAGEIYLEQIDHTLRAGDLFGEIGLFSADRRRTQTARAITDVDLLWISESELAQICYSKPGLSFYFLRLTTTRLIANGNRVSPITTAALHC
jgi:CRP/FNR family transcriptional regulator, cyclic AMP receptor protein